MKVKKYEFGSKVSIVPLFLKIAKKTCLDSILISKYEITATEILKCFVATG